MAGGCYRRARRGCCIATHARLTPRPSTLLRYTLCGQLLVAATPNQLMAQLLTATLNQVRASRASGRHRGQTDVKPRTARRARDAFMCASALPKMPPPTLLRAPFRQHLHSQIWTVVNGFLIPYPQIPRGWKWLNRISPTTWVLYGLGKRAAVAAVPAARSCRWHRRRGFTLAKRSGQGGQLGDRHLTWTVALPFIQHRVPTVPASPGLPLPHPTHPPPPCRRRQPAGRQRGPHTCVWDAEYDRGSLHGVVSGAESG